MESISKATCSLGLIAFSLECRSGHLVAEDGTRMWSFGRRSTQLIENFVSATEDLLEILETLDSSPHNPMAEPPPGFEQAAEACATDIEKMRQAMGEDSRYRAELALKIRKIERRTSTLRSYVALLNPYMNSLAGDTEISEGLQGIYPTLVSTALEVEVNDEIDTSGPIPRRLRIFAEDLYKGKVAFSATQLFQLLKTLRELQDLDFPEHDSEISYEAMDWQDFCEMLYACERGLCSISLLNHPERPTPEARKTIITLQKLAAALRAASQQNSPSPALSGIKRKAEIEDEEDEDGRIAGGSYVQGAKRVKIDFDWTRWTPRKSAASFYMDLTPYMKR